MRLLLAIAFLGIGLGLTAAPPDPAPDVAFLQALIERGEFDLARDFARDHLKAAAPPLKPYFEYVFARMEAELAIADADELAFLKNLAAAAPKLAELAKQEADHPFGLEAAVAVAELELRKGQYFSQKAGEQ